jgi:hypothetical protein
VSVALVAARPDARMRGLADELHAELVEAGPGLRLLDRLTSRRGFEDDLAWVPVARRRCARFGLLHAFSMPAGGAAAGSGRPFVLSFGVAPCREELAARRGRLALVQSAVRAARVVTAADADVAAAVERWLGVPARVLDPFGDPAACAALHREVSS